MSDQWSVVSRTVRGNAAFILVDVGFRSTSAGPDRSKPWRVEAAIAFDRPTVDGFGDSAECQSLDRSFQSAIAGVADVTYVARIRSGGRVMFWMYTSSAVCKQLESVILAGVRPRVVDVTQVEDPTWSAYEAILPTKADLRVEKDTQVIMQLMKHGDPLTVPRDVRHYTYFSSEGAANQFAQAARELGFQVKISGSAEPTSDQSVLALVSRDDPVGMPGISRLTERIEGLAENHGGTYDGWESQVVQPSKPGFVSRLLGRFGKTQK